MPELPEVETIVRNFRPRLVGQRIASFNTSWPKSITPSFPRVRSALTDRSITALTRRGKFIVLHLNDASWLLVHLRMSGRFEWAADAPRRPNHIRSTWRFTTGEKLYFCDARKFGRITHTHDLAIATADLGPEPLARNFTPTALRTILKQRRRQLKPLLLDQSVIAGLGNIYTDEALHRAGLHPATTSDRVSATQSERLHESIRSVLRLAIRNHGTSIDWIYPGGWMQKRLRVYGRTNEPCRTCGTPIKSLRIAQRGTHICPKCQPKNGHKRTRRRKRSTKG